MKYVLPLVLLLVGCAETACEKEWKQTYANIAEACWRKGGDEIIPYGARSWISLFMIEHPNTFRCTRLDRSHKKTLAVYIVREKEGRLYVEIR